MNINDKGEIMQQFTRTARKMFSGGHRRGRMHFGRTQWMLVQSIIDNPGVSQEELAAKMDLDKTTIAKAVKKLEMHGMLKREKSPEDARKYQLFADDKASEFKDEMNEQRNERIALVLENIDDAELEAFSSTLKKIEENIENNKLSIGNRRFETVAKVINTLIENPGQSKEDLLEKLEGPHKRFDLLLKELVDRNLIKEKDGLYYPTEKAKQEKLDFSKRHLHRGEHGRRRPHRGHRNFDND